MRMASVVSERSTCSRLQVGAILTKSSRILSTGYNGNIAGLPHCDHTEDSGPCRSAVHAEANAILFAARLGMATEGSLLVSTHEPCLECSKLIVNSGISEVWFENPYRDHAGVKLLRKAGVKVWQKTR